MKKYKIAVIGAGKLSFSLTPALINSGYDIQCTVSKKLSSAKSFAKKFNLQEYSDSLKKIPKSINVFLLTVPDGQIGKTAVKLSNCKNNFSGSICIHFSGVENISALESLKKKGCATGSLHIIRSFPSKDIIDISSSPASIETGDLSAKRFLIRLCKALKLKPHFINPEEKVFYHLAAVHSSNFLVGNLFNAFSFINSGKNLPKEILKKTTQSALDNVFKLSAAKALSGPIDRGDIFTIKKHVEQFDQKIKLSHNRRLKLLRKNYILQSFLLLDIVKIKYGKLSKDHREIESYLKKLLS